MLFAEKRYFSDMSDKMKYKITLVRHGESEWNKANKFCGWFDADLSEKGVDEAKSAGQVLPLSRPDPRDQLVVDQRCESGLY